ncbi:hypothetical protein ACF1BQ_022755 [Bradyrhizobium sp. RDT10]
MTKFIPAIAVALLATAIATPVLAQAAIQEPGAYAFYHPNADVTAGRSVVRPPVSADAYAYYRSGVPARERLPVAPRHRRTVR